jgi:putative ABC transport system substrate-binding protein
MLPVSISEFSIGGKWLNLLKEIAPGLKRVAVLFNPDTAPYFKFFLPVFDAAAGPLGVHAITLPVLTESDIEPALTEFAREPNGGLMLMGDSFMRHTFKRSQIWPTAIACLRSPHPNLPSPAA